MTINNNNDFNSQLSFQDMQTFITTISDATSTKKAQFNQLKQELGNQQAKFDEKIKWARIAALTSEEEGELLKIAKEIELNLSSAFNLDKQIKLLEQCSEKLSEKLKDVSKLVSDQMWKLLFF